MQELIDDLDERDDREPAEGPRSDIADGAVTG